MYVKKHQKKEQVNKRIKEKLGKITKKKQQQQTSKQ